ncbi:MAG TPA: response regulator, partial [Candidatus Nitrosotenuis sp.]|nr:response regulator [Candidatus Nitrosotenuis sp.]
MKAGQFAPAELATILVIEDDPRVQEMLGLQLSTLGYQVLQALDGISGLRWLEQEAVGVVILDLNLPDTG